MTAAAVDLGPKMTVARIIGAYLSDAKYESLRLLRTPAFAMPILAMPILFYTFFGVVLNGGGHRPPGFADMMFVGWTVYGVMGPGLFGFGILVAVERNMGLLTYKRALPMPAGSYLAAKLMMAYVFAIVVMAMLVTAGLTIGHVTLPPLKLLTVAAVMSLGVIPACAIGLFIGAWAPASSASAIANIVYLGMAFLSGLFFPLSGVLHDIRFIWPTYHLKQLAMASAGMPSEGSLVSHAGVLAAMSGVLILAASRKLARRG
ncbi:ABC transporter permease [Phenylobacterium sp.]|jgi:ABC-2 type transport system permease protein|uniref:ABC transporter permease n=1 Tax=Phenylobacterium sp. TaxID=1871053 RepID=UPI002E3276F0|nr:ABC transporter permease [Phenylobacterium sp.]HEX3363438.1 ABC transporter permease [Phenylobacterium sp.]